jgi:predicted O-methyltransferase YrrM
VNLFDLDAQHPTHLPTTLGWSFREARILQVAVRFKLFSALNQEAKSAVGLASELGTHPEMTERLLTALASLDLVIHDDGLWRNCLAASIYLVEGQPLYQGDVLEMAADVWTQYNDLERLVREGPREESAVPGSRQHPNAATYIRAMHAIAVAGQAQRLARFVGALASRRTLLDVGGAPGTYSIALCQRFPGLKATVWDTQAALALAEQTVREHDLSDRIRFKAGDLQKDRLGRGEYEALLLNHLLMGAEANVLPLLVKAYEALKPGGLLIVQNRILDDDLNGNQDAALDNVLEGLLTLEQMRTIVAEAGFERVTLLYRSLQGTDILTAIKPMDAPPSTREVLMERISPEQEIFALMGYGEEESGESLLRRLSPEQWVQPN